MNVQIVVRRFECSQSTQDEIKKRMEKLSEHFPSPVSARVILEKEDYRFKCEILLQGKFDAKATADASDLDATFEKAYARIEKQLKKFKEKIKNHKSRGEKFSQLREVVMSPEGIENVEFVPGIIEETPYIIKPMSPDEAIMQMELLGKEFYVFSNEQDEKLNIVYRRTDGNYGLIKK